MPASIPTDSSASKTLASQANDLGSDDEWDGCISDEDVDGCLSDDDPAQPPQTPPYDHPRSVLPASLPALNPALQPSSHESFEAAPADRAQPAILGSASKPSASNNDPLNDFKWGKNDVEYFVEPTGTPTTVPAPAEFQPHPLPSNESKHSYFHLHHAPQTHVTPPSSGSHLLDDIVRMQQASTPPPRPSDDTDTDAEASEQQSVIPGYRGVSNRSSNSAPHTRSNIFPDRPRGSSNPHPHPHPHPHPPDPASGGSSPALARLHRMESDSAVSSTGSGSALRLSTRTSSETSEGSRRATTKSVTFIAPLGDGLPTPPHDDDAHGGAGTPVTADPAALLAHPISEQTTVNNLLTGPFTSSTRLEGAPVYHDAVPSDDIETDDELGSSPNSQYNGRVLNDTHHSPSPRDASFGLPASVSDPGGTPRQRSSLSSPPGADRNGTGLADAPAMYVEGLLPTIPNRREKAKNAYTGNISSSHPSMLSSSVTGMTSLGSELRPNYTMASSGVRNLSFLECVAELLKGSIVMRRKNFMQASETSIWLAEDLRRIQFRVQKKTLTPVVETIHLSKVRRLKGTERELVIEAHGYRKPLDFVFAVRDNADLWLSGLCCLVPSNSVVKSRNRRLEVRQHYDPLMDSWNGKALVSRKRLRDYILLGTIGHGSFGKVKLSLSVTDLRFYAVKVLSKTMLRKQMRNQQFEGSYDGGNRRFSVVDIPEVAVMQKLDHPNVIRMEAHYEDDEKDAVYIVLEYVANGPIMSSSRLTDAARIPEDRARMYFVDVLCGLEYLHKNNVAHRDIKPDNLLQAGDGTVKVSDFGTAIRYADENGEGEIKGALESSGRSVGTPAFLAPELCMSGSSPPCPERVFAADIWSLGASLYYILFGQAPFVARTVFEMYETICTEPLEFPGGQHGPKGYHVSEPARQVLRMMLNKRPEHRATFSTILRAEWLRGCPEVAEKLTDLRMSLMHSGEDGVDGRCS